MPSQRYSNEDIFDRLERLRVEVKGDIQINYNSLKQDVQGLRSDFNTLEAGRLTAVEQRTNTLEKNQGIQNYKLYVLWSIITVALTIIINFILKRASI